MRVLLAHGMGRTALSLYGLGRYLDRRGHRCDLFGYSATFQSFTAIADRLRERLRHVAESDEAYGVIGHSLGGLLLRAALPGLPPPRHFVMLGVPNRSPRLARLLQRQWLYRLINGDPGQQLADERFMTSLPPPPCPYTIIAGTGGFRGRWSPFGNELNDGTVAVDETRIGDHDQVVLLPVRHTLMMFKASVRTAIVAALGT
jgi:hypothetical protein